jgi:hypothetical protein
MDMQDRLGDIESKISQMRDVLSNLEMAISPLSVEHLNRIKWMTQTLQPVQSPFEMIRIGKPADGGYVVAPPIIGGTTLSLGVGDEISADITLIQEFNHSVYAFDPYVERPIEAPLEFKFHKIGLGSQTNRESGNLYFEDIHSIMSKLPMIPNLALIDIEGSEWELANSFEAISQIPQIVIEMHELDLIVDDSKFVQIKKLLTKIIKTHLPVHVHANNDGSTVRLAGAVWPSILEVTFLTRTQLSELSTNYNFGPWPGKLDYPNSPKRPDLDLQPFFGPIATYRNELQN